MACLFEQCQDSRHTVPMVLATKIRAQRASYHHGNLEESLIKAAIKLVRKNGPDHLSLRTAASDIGVSPSAAYHYFPDKSALLDGIGDYLFADLANMQEEALSKITGNTARAAKARFRALGEIYFKWAMKEPNLFRLMFGGFCSIEDTEPAESPAYKLLSKTLDELVASGAMSKSMRPYGEIISWSSVHGATTLIVEGHMPSEAFDSLLDGIQMSLGMGK
jgi:AcrR family transcriptional regulator